MISSTDGWRSSLFGEMPPSFKSLIQAIAAHVSQSAKVVSVFPDDPMYVAVKASLVVQPTPDCPRCGGDLYIMVSRRHGWATAKCEARDECGWMIRMHR